MRNAPPTFLLGSMRSGTTLLRYLLNSHDHLACPPETKILAALAHPQIVPALCALGPCRKEVMVRLRALIESFLDEHASAAGKRRWVDKTPAYCMAWRFLDELFEHEAKYLLLFRHPLDCVVSLQKLSERYPHFPAEDPHIERLVQQHGAGLPVWAYYWSEANSQLLTLLRTVPARCHPIFYEELAVNPKLVVTEALQWMDEDPVLLRLEKAFDSYSEGYQDDKIRETNQVHRRSVGASFELEPRVRESLWRIVADTAERLGYAEQAVEIDVELRPKRATNA